MSGMATFVAILTVLTVITIGAQQPPQQPPPPQPPQGGFAASFPPRPPADPAVVERGKALYSVNCAFCHGADARGGDGGPSLLRSSIVLDDQHGEAIAPVVQAGRLDRGMPKFAMTNEQISDIAAFIHSFRAAGYDVSRQKPQSILVGDAKAGEAYFNATCASCHSVTGDLKGFGARFTDPKTLQQTWLMPGMSGRRAPVEQVHIQPATVTVTLASGEKVEGTVDRIDDFVVSLTASDGTHRGFQRDGDVPKVEVHDPLQAHRKLLPVYTDADIHNVTAYLAGLK